METTTLGIGRIRINQWGLDCTSLLSEHIQAILKFVEEGHDYAPKTQLERITLLRSKQARLNNKSYPTTKGPGHITAVIPFTIEQIRKRIDEGKDLKLFLVIIRVGSETVYGAV